MQCQTLVSNKRYRGKYVALRSFQENKVVASGKEPVKVLERANKKGVSSPVIVFVPLNHMTHVY